MTSDAPRSLTLIVNPSAAGGGALTVVEAVEARLRDRGATVRTVRSQDEAHAVAAAREAVDRGDVVAAVGGDGMLRIVADAIVGRPGATLATIPAGRGNDFVRYLGLPDDPAAAADALIDGAAVPFDTGRAVGEDGVPHAFLSIAACGFDSEANRIANDAPARLGPLAYVWGVLGSLAGLRPIPYRLRLDGVPVEHVGLTVAVANTGAYGGGMHVAPNAEVDDGRFDVVMIGHEGRHRDRCDWRDRLRLLRFFPRVFRGTHVELDLVDVQRAAEVRVEADGPLAVFADGDPIGTLPMTFTVDPDGLSLIVPGSHPLASSAARKAAA